MTLKEQIQQDLIASMKEKDELKTGALRMLKAAILKWEVDGIKKQAQDEDVVNLAHKEIKQRQQAASQYRDGNRPELAEKEEAEIKILEKYLPEQLSESEIDMIVREAIAQTGSMSKTDMGKVMAQVMLKVKGKADGSVVNRIVAQLLP